MVTHTLLLIITSRMAVGQGIDLGNHVSVGKIVFTPAKALILFAR
jgi:hypothetical protein